MQKKLVLISPTSQRLVELFGLDIYILTGRWIRNVSTFELIFALVWGLIIIYASFQMRKDGSEKIAAKATFLFSIMNLFIIGVGGILGNLGSLFGIIGSTFAFFKK